MWARLLVGIFLCAAVSSPAPPRAVPAWKANPDVRRVLIVSIDGLRPDLLLRADAPNVRALMKRGSYTMWARTIADAYTLPAHLSMLTGVTSEKHGITWNDYTEDSYPQTPTIFDLAKKKGLSTAIAVAKMKFIVLKRPGMIDFPFIADEDKQGDADVVREAVKIIREHKPAVMFVHLANVDVVGHAEGWGSAKQIEAIHLADAQLGEVLEAMRGAGAGEGGAGAGAGGKLEEHTLILLSSDHGGSGRGHGPDDAPSADVPWIAAGPRVRENFDLTLMRGRPISVMDTFATAAAALGIEVAYPIDGRPVEAIYTSDESLHALPAW